MNVFVTGATGFVGSAVVAELLEAGHRVTGLARSDAAVAKLEIAGAMVHRGTLDDLRALARGAAAADGVVHVGFVTPRNRGSMTYAQAADMDRRAIETLVTTLAGSGRPLVVTSGTALAITKPALETDFADPASVVAARAMSETVALAAAGAGVRSTVVRLPQVHGDDDVGYLAVLVGLARDKRVSAYVGDGRNRWPSVHRLDAANLYRLALERGDAGVVYHAVADEGVELRAIASVIGRRLGVPVVSFSEEEAAAHFGAAAALLAVDNPASSVLTRERLGWEPVHATLLADLDDPRYFP